MIVATAEIKIYVPWAHSLKEKRMVVKSIIAKVQNRCKIAIAEVDAQDYQQTIVLGLAAVSSSAVFAERSIDRALDFIASNTEAEIQVIRRGNF